MKTACNRKNNLLRYPIYVLFFSVFFFVGKDDCCAKNYGVKFDSMTTEITGDNPFNCPGSTTVLVKIHYTVKKILRRAEDGSVRLKYAKGMGNNRGGWKQLSKGTITIDTRNKHVDSSYVESITFTLTCDTCCLGGITGNEGSSGKKKLNLKSTFGNWARSSYVTVTCMHEEAQSNISIDDTSGPIGQDATFFVESSHTLYQVKDIEIRTVYDPSAFSPVNASFIDPLLAEYETFYISEPDTMVLETHLPISETMDVDPGEIAEFTVDVLDISVDSIYIAQFNLASNSVVIDNLDDTLAVDWDMGYFLILPDDNNPPDIDFNNINHNPIFMAGSPGAITDDFDYLTDSLLSYTRFRLYDNETSRWAVFDVDTSGGFYTDDLWLQPSEEIELIVFDLAGNENPTTLAMQSHFGCVFAGLDASGMPGSEVSVEFDLLNWSYEPHSYDITITDTEGWPISPPPTPVDLDPMQEMSITLDVSIPPGTDIGTINWIYMIANSTDDPSITDYDSLYVVVEDEPIPTLSEWGLIILALLLLAVGTIAVVRRRKAAISKTV